jgi:DNA-binding transcriptional MocR family regulator
MPKEGTFQDLSLGSPSGKQDLWRWLYTELRAAILDGRLKPGVRMPSTRSLGKQYSLSRGTVVIAFDQLQAEGYTRTEVGSGTYVASGVPERFLTTTRKPVALALATSKAALSKGAQQFLRDVEVLPASRSVGKAFRSYEPAIDLFPVELWARVASRVLRRARFTVTAMLRATSPSVELSRNMLVHHAGYAALRNRSSSLQAHNRHLTLSAVFSWRPAIRSGWKTRAITARSNRFVPPVRVSYRYRSMETASS